MFYFIRHGETDESGTDTKIFKGYGVNLAPLTERGAEQIRQAAKDGRLNGADLILCSPYTRAVQSAAILSRTLDVDLRIETDLHEWLANKNYVFEDWPVAEQAWREYEAGGGTYVEGEKLWEDAETMRARVLPVLRKYAHLEKVIVVCHSNVISAVTGGPRPACAEIVEYELH